MIKILLIPICLLISSHSFAQGFINGSKHRATRYFGKLMNKGVPIAVLKETDSTLFYLIRDSSFQDLDIYLHFSKSGKCDRETRIAGCDTCFQKYLTTLVNAEKFGWLEINETSYISKFSKKLILEIPAPFTYVIRPFKMTKKEYKEFVSR